MSVRDNWDMECPQCKNDDKLRIRFTGTLELTSDGSVDSGNHEWGNLDACRCEVCGWEGIVIGAVIQKPVKPQTFTVKRHVDAYLVSYQDVKATCPVEARELAIKADVWEYSHTSEFDNTIYTVDDEMGEEVMGT